MCGDNEVIGFRQIGQGKGGKLKDGTQTSEDVVIAELFHGPTLAFKVKVKYYYYGQYKILKATKTYYGFYVCIFFAS